MNTRRVELSTSVYVTIEDWDNTRQEIVGSSESVRILNNRLFKFYSGINDIYNQLEATNEEFDVYDIKEKIVGTTAKHYFLIQF